MKRATQETEAGRRYLDPQRKARHSGRPTDELIQLYALEEGLDRLLHKAHVILIEEKSCRAKDHIEI